MSSIKHILNQALQKNHLVYSEAIIGQLLHYLDLLQTWNKVFNLTAVTDSFDLVYLHLIDSLAISPYLHGQRLLDVGTGAGLPGLPLAISHPEQHWVLLDKNSKKTRFLTQVVAELHLSNIEVVHSRSEYFHHDACFDTILSRALGTISLFASIAEHLLCHDGLLIAMKGKYPREELSHLPDGFQLLDVTEIQLKGFQVERHIVRLTKLMREHRG